MKSKNWRKGVVQGGWKDRGAEHKSEVKTVGYDKMTGQSEWAESD